MNGWRLFALGAILVGTDYKTERNFRLIREFGVLDEEKLSERSLLRPANLRRFLLANLASCVLVGCVLTSAVLVDEHFNGQLWITMVVNFVVVLLFWLFYRSIFNKAFFEREDLLGRFLWDVYLYWGLLGAIVVLVALMRLIPASGRSDYVTLTGLAWLYAGAMHLLGTVAVMIREKTCRDKVLLWQRRYAESMRAQKSTDPGWELD
jgi:hypothetical protein